jgi:hypothetical protein
MYSPIRAKAQRRRRGEVRPILYLSAVPEDAREYVTGYLKDAEKNVNSRLSEAAEIRDKPAWRSEWKVRTSKD